MIKVNVTAGVTGLGGFGGVPPRYGCGGEIVERDWPRCIDATNGYAP